MVRYIGLFCGHVLIIKPLQRLEEVVIYAASGDISEDVEIPKVDNEIRSLALAFNSMLSNLRNMVQHIDDNFTQTNEKVLAISNETAAVAQQSTAISKTTCEIASGAENSAIAIEATVESVQDVIKIAENVEQKAKSSENVSVEMVEYHKAKVVVQSLISGIGNLAEDNQQSLKTVKELEKDASQIEQVLDPLGKLLRKRIYLH